ncbi:MAG TPA: PLP-dependent aminotransferase family protein [Sandaracinaceae bacterium LLY-WYZ-13_1]|nr:PLP-dependent aminotransferase family protein [Sandaracinaceae bacterium LLY-WYZ-13_1]
MSPTDLGLTVCPGEGPIYQQIFDAIAGRIRRGAFPDGYRLPPTRALATQIGAHRNTVVRAYAELEAAGFLTSTVGRGTFVRAPQAAESSVPAPSADARGLRWSSMLSGAARSEPLRRVTRLRRASPPPGVIDLTRMQPPPELLPVELLRRCVDHVLRTSGPRALQYAPKQGFRRLRAAVVEDLARLGVPAAADDVLITTGSQQGLDLVARALLDPGDVVLTHASTYAGALQVFAATGAHVVGVPNDAHGPDLEALHRLGARRPKVLYLMPNHVNPTGACMSAERREAVLGWARDAQVAVIEDDYAVDLVLDDVATPPALRARDPDVLHVGTFSKRLIPALRIGYLVAPSALRPHLLALKHTSDLGSSALSQHSLAEFLERGYLGAHLNKIQPFYRARRDALLEGLRAHLPADVRWQRPARGLTIWLELPEDVDPERVFEEGLARKVLVGPGHHFAVDEGARPGLRLSFCHEPEARLGEGAARVAEAIEAVRARAGGAAGGVELV